MMVEMLAVRWLDDGDNEAHNLEHVLWFGYEGKYGGLVVVWWMVDDEKSDEEQVGVMKAKAGSNGRLMMKVSCD